MKQLLVLLLIPFFLAACSKKSTQVTYKLSDDICLLCNNPPRHIIGNDTLWAGNIITPNGDNYNDCFTIHTFHTFSRVDSLNLTIFDRDGRQVVHFDHYMNDWPKYIPSSTGQDLTGLSNGLYRYMLTSGLAHADGLFIILFRKDAYADKQVEETGCVNCCRCPDNEDPAFFIL